MTANVPAWAEWLQAEGYAALALDSFKARGLQSVCADSRLFTGVMRAGDVFAAVARLKTVSAVDPNRIAAMGFSHGGGTLLAAWRQAARHPDQKLRGMIAFYPGGCVGALAPADAPPLLMLVGGRDDWTPPEPCEKLAGTAKDAGRPVSIVVYPDAYHHFDGADLKKRVYSSVARGGKGATMEYNPKAHADSEKQVRVFLETHMKP
jgi:dienelactone hydrolase